MTRERKYVAVEDAPFADLACKRGTANRRLKQALELAGMTPLGPGLRTGPPPPTAGLRRFGRPAVGPGAGSGDPAPTGGGITLAELPGPDCHTLNQIEAIPAGKKRLRLGISKCHPSRFNRWLVGRRWYEQPAGRKAVGL
jgi:hypothetical protein